MLVVDDVVTTELVLTAMTRCLLENKAAVVYAAVLARTDIRTMTTIIRFWEEIFRQTRHQIGTKNVEKLAGEMVRRTRGSQLARTQTGHVIDQLHHGFRVEEVIISTRGDQKQTVPIAQIGNDGVFVRELEKHFLKNESIWRSIVLKTCQQR